jgi:hypothetical protein
MAAHTIRLREPWDRFVSTTGEYCLRRRFNLPTGIDNGERVSLVVAPIGGLAIIKLNDLELGQILAEGDLQRWEITKALRARNEVCLVIVGALENQADSGREPLVRLEIEQAAPDCGELPQSGDGDLNR